MTEVRDKNLCKRVPTLLPDRDTHFIDCNLLNCNFAPDSGNTFTSCLRLTKEYCSHINPEYVAEGLPECPVNCEHVIRITDAVVIDGREIVKAENVYATKVTKLDGSIAGEE